MKAQHHDMIEGTEASERFRKAMKAILSVPKTAIQDRAKSHNKKKKAASRKG